MFEIKSSGSSNPGLLAVVHKYIFNFPEPGLRGNSDQLFKFHFQHAN